ncbi:MAG: SGNH/GDSL hydrolase family protein [Acetobacteraceae bacterium]
MIGDSIALGVGQTLPECRTEAQVGITSQRFAQEVRSPPAADKVVISLGANDGASPAIAANLERVRSSVRASTVYWLLPPHGEYARAAIRDVALRFGDWLIDYEPAAGPDGLHPTGAGYRSLGALIRSAGT